MSDLDDAVTEARDDLAASTAQLERVQVAIDALIEPGLTYNVRSLSPAVQHLREAMAQLERVQAASTRALREAQEELAAATFADVEDDAFGPSDEVFS